MIPIDFFKLTWYTKDVRIKRGHGIGYLASVAKVIKFQYINKLEELVILSIAKDLARKREYSNPLDSRFLVQTRNDNKLNSTLLNTHCSLLLTIFTSLSRRVVFAIYTTSQATRLSGDVKNILRERK